MVLASQPAEASTERCRRACPIWLAYGSTASARKPANRYFTTPHNAPPSATAFSRAIIVQRRVNICTIRNLLAQLIPNAVGQAQLAQQDALRTQLVTAQVLVAQPQTVCAPFLACSATVRTERAVLIQLANGTLPKDNALLATALATPSTTVSPIQLSSASGLAASATQDATQHRCKDLAKTVESAHGMPLLQPATWPAHSTRTLSALHRLFAPLWGARASLLAVSPRLPSIVRCYQRRAAGARQRKSASCSVNTNTPTTQQLVLKIQHAQ